MTGSNPWILKSLKQRELDSQARMRLFCFPPAGTSACAFQKWFGHLPSDVEIMPVELPGRNTRGAEPCHEDMNALVRDIVNGILPLMEEKPFALFGHSLGSWVVHETALLLERMGGPSPVKLYVSASRPPQLSDTKHDWDPTRLGDLDFDKFWPAFERRFGHVPNLQRQAVREFAFPVLHSDFKLLESYKPTAPAASDGGGVSCGIVAFGGDKDDRFTGEQLEAWSKETKGDSQTVWLSNCGHRYIMENPEQLLEFLSRDLGLVNEM